MVTRKRPAAKKVAGDYEPPISWARFDAMRRAVYGQLYDRPRVPISDEALNELHDALMLLHGIYQRDLAKTLPPRKIQQEDLVEAAAARWLIDSEGWTLREALVAMRVPMRVEWHSIVKTYNKRCEALGPSGIYGIKDMRPLLARIRRARIQARWDARLARRAER